MRDGEDRGGGPSEVARRPAPSRGRMPLPVRGRHAALAAMLIATTAPCPEMAHASETELPLDPPRDDGPVEVEARFHLLQVLGIEDEAETMEFAGVLTLRWRDARLAFDPDAEGTREKVYQGPFQFSELAPSWFPQVVLANAAGAPEMQGLVHRVTPDGTSTLVQQIHGAAYSRMELLRYPFDRQQFELVFEVLGFKAHEVSLVRGNDAASVQAGRVNVPQWRFTRIRAETREIPAPYGASPGATSAFVLRVDVERQPFFMLRLVILPLALIVMLSWSVFWMERSSVGDRMSVSFVGILTAVAYQTMVSAMTPQFSQVSFMHAFLSFSLIVMCASVVINLIVATYDKRGDAARGDLVDQRARWAFPLAYAVLLGVGFVFCFLL